LATKITERLRKIRISLISLVTDPANKVQAVFKSAEGNELREFQTIAKLDEEGYLTSLVYIPEVADTDGQAASKEEILDACNAYPLLMKGSGIDVMHDCEPVDKDEAHLCQNFIVQKGDERFNDVVIDGEKIDATGSWAVVLKLNSERLRAPYRTGVWNGVSMYGSALVSAVSKSGAFPEAFADRLGTSTPKENKMDEEKLAAAIAKALAPVVAKVEEVATAVAKLNEVEDPDKDKVEVIKFTGDPESLKDIEAHEVAIFKASLDFSNPADLVKWKAHLAKQAELEGAPAGETEDQRELRIAKARVEELSKASNQDTDESNPNETAAEKVARIRKSAKETANRVLISQGRRQPTK